MVHDKTSIGYSGYAPDLPGLIATGDTKEVTGKNMIEGIPFHLEGLAEEDLPIPLSEASGEVLMFAGQ